MEQSSCRGEDSPCSTAECVALDARTPCGLDNCAAVEALASFPICLSSASLQCWLENSVERLGGPLWSPDVPYGRGIYLYNKLMNAYASMVMD
jgi:hypothetical protein